MSPCADRTDPVVRTTGPAKSHRLSGPGSVSVTSQISSQTMSGGSPPSGRAHELPTTSGLHADPSSAGCGAVTVPQHCCLGVFTHIGKQRSRGSAHGPRLVVRQSVRLRKFGAEGFRPIIKLPAGAKFCSQFCSRKSLVPKRLILHRSALSGAVF